MQADMRRRDTINIEQQVHQQVVGINLPVLVAVGNGEPEVVVHLAVVVLDGLVEIVVLDLAVRQYQLEECTHNGNLSNSV